MCFICAVHRCRLTYGPLCYCLLPPVSCLWELRVSNSSCYDKIQPRSVVIITLNLNRNVTWFRLFWCLRYYYCTLAAQGTEALPEVTIRPVFQAIPSGEAATFACVISSPETSVLNVTWLHNGTSLPPTDARFSTSDLELTISNFSEDLAGNYTCVVANSVGIVSSSVAELQIACE